MDFLTKEFHQQQEKMKEMMEMITSQNSFMVDHQQRLQIKASENDKDRNQNAINPVENELRTQGSSSTSAFERDAADEDEKLERFFSSLVSSPSAKESSFGVQKVASANNLHSQKSFRNYLKKFLSFALSSTSSSSLSSEESVSAESSRLLSLFADLYAFLHFHLSDMIVVLVLLIFLLVLILLGMMLLLGYALLVKK
jgi:uncharacterized FlgJ-related protein